MKRQAAEKRGHFAETVALLYLMLKGYRLLARRYKTPLGEVDLIMRRGQVTAFIEVKARATHDEALLSVTPRQAKRISQAASLWMARDKIAAQNICRFDIVAVNARFRPKHIENAFSGDR
jgi:putative endonuclease